MSERTYKLLDGRELVLDGWLNQRLPGESKLRRTNAHDELENVLALVDSLQQQLAERDRTIARLSADLDSSVSSQIDMTDKAYRYQKALEEAKTAIQKNLAFANGKDEQALLSAFNHINTALGRE